MSFWSSWLLSHTMAGSVQWKELDVSPPIILPPMQPGVPPVQWPWLCPTDQSLPRVARDCQPSARTTFTAACGTRTGLQWNLKISPASSAEKYLWASAPPPTHKHKWNIKYWSWRSRDKIILGILLQVINTPAMIRIPDQSCWLLLL